MDPLTSIAVGHGAGKLLDYVGSTFKSNVIDRWSQRRAERFFLAFCEEVVASAEIGDFERARLLLDEIVHDEACSEVLFDAYRRVALSRSKEIGPRIIGLMTARLVHEGRKADDYEEGMLMAAEHLSDDELLDFASYVATMQQRAEDPLFKDVSMHKYGFVQIRVRSEQIELTHSHGTNVVVGPLNLMSEVGTWAQKAADFGLIDQETRERYWDYDADDIVDEPGSVREVAWWIYLRNPATELAQLIERLQQSTDR